MTQSPAAKTPARIKLPFKAKETILAVGAHLKSAFCAVSGREAFISEDFGNLDDVDNLKRFEAEVRKHIKRFKPQVFACDLHPEYLSTKFLKNYLLSTFYSLLQIQHHHAHIAACMADNGAGPKDRLIGVAFDGTGLGTDGNIWGSEFLVCGYKDFKRIAHLEYVPMPGGESAAREPWRMAFSYLYTAGIQKTAAAKRLKVLKNMIDNGFNCPLSCGMGRLFDAVSAMLGLCETAEFEAEAAIKLEKIADRSHNGSYKFDLEGENIKVGRILKAVLTDKKKKVQNSIISARFHNTIARIILDVIKRIRKTTGIKTVALSGGVFQNKYLTHRAVNLLSREGFKVLRHRQVPCTDAGISLGQAVIGDAPFHKS